MAAGGPVHVLGDALFTLARTPLAHLDAAIDHLLETAARTLQVERVGLWRYVPGRMGIALQRQYVLGSGFQSQHIELLAANFPRYFEALETTLALAADDARSDPRTSEFTPTYLEPLGITSMLDVPVRVFGRPFGIVCHEQVGPPRSWSESEQIFAAAIGMLMSLAFEQEEHRRSAQAHENSRLYDPLTGLPGRSLFVDRVEQALRSGTACTVLALDVDRFKLVNESFGHACGDALLIEVARRLAPACPLRSTLARLGNDEFALLAEATGQPTDAARLAERLLASLEGAFRAGGASVDLTASIGVAISDGRGGAGELLRDAETALARARSRGGAHHEMFDASMSRASLDRLQLDVDLRRAVERHRYYTEFQPIVTLADGRLRGLEALVRWRHDERGLVPPIEFVLACEQLGLISRLGLGVLEEALACAARLRALLGTAPFMSVNVSPIQLGAADFAGQVQAALERHQLAGAALSLEITEGSLLEGSRVQLETLERLRQLGVRAYLDDFGTGYGFLTHLRSLPVAAVKIDRAFTTALPDDRGAAAIVSALVRLAHGLGLEVIAEGVETAAQFDYLRRLGCDAAQGFWIAHPVAATALDSAFIDAVHAHLAQYLAISDLAVAGA